jgi:two-component system sensor histidine kinase/response regulator
VRLDARVLLVEDAVDNQRLLAFYLREAGAAVDVAGDGVAACEMAMAAVDADAPYDVVLMDVQMPRTSGLQATAAIRAHERAHALPRTPIIALTAHAMGGDRERCLGAGMDDYVAKPVDAEELFRAIERLGGAGRSDVPPASVAAASIVVDRDAMVRRVGADPELLLEMIETFNVESRALLRDVRHSVVERDAERLEQVAHSLKGALRTLAAPAASEAASQLETMARERDLSRVDDGWRSLETEMQTLERALSALVTPATA